jgi:hypothetical protein
MFGGGDMADGAAAAGTNAGCDRGAVRVAHGGRAGFDGRSTQQPRALLPSEARGQSLAAEARAVLVVDLDVVMMLGPVIAM